MGNAKGLKSKGEPQLFFAIALFIGSFFLFLGIDLVSFSWLGSNLDTQAVFKRTEERNFLRANLASKHYPIRDYSKEGPNIEADSFLVYDARSAELLADYQLNKKLPIASITKLINALVVKENENFYSQKGYLRIPALNDFPVEPQLERRKEYKYKDLFRAMLAASNNEAAYSFAEEFPGGKTEFLKAMETKARELGMQMVELSNPAGFDKNGGSYASAKGLLLLAQEISKKYPDILKATLERRVVLEKKTGGEPIHLYNTNYFVHNGSPTQLMGQKTGRTSLAGECMILIEKGEFGKIVYILLGSQDRVVDMNRLINWTHEAYKFGNM